MNTKLTRLDFAKLLQPDELVAATGHDRGLSSLDLELPAVFRNFVLAPKNDRLINTE
jgi:hypothetical protein